MLSFNFIPFPELQTERLLLRRLTPEDAAEIFLLRSDEKILQYIGREPETSIEEAIAFIEQIHRAEKANESIMWAITFRDDPRATIGTICYWRIQPANYRAEIGYSLLPAYWKKGIMKETIRRVLDYGFEVMKLHSVEARICPGNIASEATLVATGFVKEGHLKEDFFFRDAFHDTIIYSRLRDKAGSN